jgi:hypothetical protein
VIETIHRVMYPDVEIFSPAFAQAASEDLREDFHLFPSTDAGTPIAAPRKMATKRVRSRAHGGVASMCITWLI